MKIKEMRALIDRELEQKVSEFKKEIFNLKFQRSTGKSVGSVKRIKSLKRNVAQALTILNEKRGKEKGEEAS